LEHTGVSFKFLSKIKMDIDNLVSQFQKMSIAAEFPPEVKELQTREACLNDEWEMLIKEQNQEKY
jgi:hypothetical protein